jgi:hypothetical protein
MSPRASLRVEGSPPSLVWSLLQRSCVRRRGLVSATATGTTAASANSTGAPHGHRNPATAPGHGIGHGPSRYGAPKPQRQGPRQMETFQRSEKRTTLRAGDLAIRRLGRGDMGGVTFSSSTQSRGTVRSWFSGTATDRIVAEHRVLRSTGLLPRSAPPPLQLTLLRRPAAASSSSASRSPPVGSAAFLVAAARFSGRESRGSPTRHCAHRNSNAGSTMPCTARPPVRVVS